MGIWTTSSGQPGGPGAASVEEPSRDGDRIPEWAGWPLLWCVLGLILAGYPTLLSGFADVQGGLGHPLLVNFTLEHSFRWVAGMPLAEDFWSPPIFHPMPGVAAFTDLLLGAAPLYWPWRWLGLGPHTAFQIWMFASPVVYPSTSDR